MSLHYFVYVVLIVLPFYVLIRLAFLNFGLIGYVAQLDDTVFIVGGGKSAISNCYIPGPESGPYPIKRANCPFATCHEATKQGSRLDRKDIKLMRFRGSLKNSVRRLWTTTGIHSWFCRNAGRWLWCLQCSHPGSDWLQSSQFLVPYSKTELRQCHHF